MKPDDMIQSPCWVAVTVACYWIGLGLRRATRNHALANPALIAMILVGVLLPATGTSYAVYFRATRPLTFLLAPATVALGLPLARNVLHVRNSLRGVALGLLGGCLTSMLSGVFLVRLLGGGKEVAMSMLPKAATTPIAMSVAGEIGGQPALSASLAIVGGIVAAVTLRAVLGKVGVAHGHAVGLAAGTAGSAIGAAQAATLGEGPAAFAAIGIGMNGLLTALLAPAVAAFFK
jgi:putative effector of murein hydrolase